jgi:hypothetical protein
MKSFIPKVKNNNKLMMMDLEVKNYVKINGKKRINNKKIKTNSHIT